MEMFGTAKSLEAAIAAATPVSTSVSERDIDRVTLQNFLKGIKTASFANVVPFSLVGLCGLSLDNWQPLAFIVLLASAVLVAMWLTAGKIERDLETCDASRAIRLYQALSVVSGGLWGAMMAPVAQTLGTNIESMFVCVLIVASAMITCVVCADQRRFALPFLVGFELVLVPVSLWHSDVIGLIPTIATLALVPVALTLTQVVRTQTRLIVRTQLENKMLADQLGIALKKAEYVANRDSLTGLLNRRAFEAAAEEMRLIGGNDAKLAIILVDLDHFKSINDSYGHPMGDEVLKSTATLVQEVTGPMSLIGRGDGAVARWGGEEFILLLSNCSLEHATETAELIRARLHRERPSYWPLDMAVSGSFGIADWSDDIGLHQAISMADQAMYSAKVSGRNRSCIFHEDGCLPVTQKKPEDMVEA
jgi:diguanylate cyclase (GGDEF)-like protein